MSAVRSWSWVLVLGICSFFLLATAYSTFNYPYPSITATLQSDQTELRDVAGLALGFRRLAADLAWIKTLQYYGTPEEGQSEFEFENGMGRYPKFLEMCRHVARIDPYFTQVYYYGGAVLGWNLERLNEAEALLRDGIQQNPQEWRLPMYLAGLAYQKNHDVASLVKFLEAITSAPDCPLMMKGLLANLYKKQGEFEKAQALWEDLYQTGDPLYVERAKEQFLAIERLRRQRRS
jgi:tetratricopeptide (TPR) repeat protein